MIYTPHPYQTRAHHFVNANERAGLLMDMGLGKTVVTLTAFCDLQMVGLATSALVLAPLSVAYGVWQREAAKWDHTKHLTFQLLHGKGREARLREPADIYVLNYDGLEWFQQELKEMTRKQRGKPRPEPPFNFLICDESTCIKSATSQRFKMVQRMLPFFKRRVILSATPTPNSLEDLWSQIYVLDEGERLEPYITYYRDKYFYAADRNGYQLKVHPHLVKTIYNKVADITLRLDRKDYLELPERVNNIVDVPMPDRIAEAYEELENEFFTEINGQEIDAETAATRSTKLRQLVQGSVYDKKIPKQKQTFKTHHAAKMDRMIEVVDGAGGPVIIAYQFAFEEEEILRRLQPRRNHGLYRKNHVKAISSINRDTPGAKREEIMAQWNAGELDALVVHPKVIAHGVNLQEGPGHTIIWVGLPWSWDQYHQLIGRIDRQGQRSKRIIIHHLIMPDTIDEVVYASLQRKEGEQFDLLNYLREYRKNKKSREVA